MKKLFTLLLCFITFSATAQEIKSSEEPFKRANTIIISEKGEKKLLLNKLTILLAELGYGIHNKEEETGVITTTEYGRRNSNITVRIVGIVKDSIIVLRGQFKMGISVSLSGVSTVPEFEEIRYGGMKGSPLRNAWDELTKIATKLNGQIIYSIN